MKSFYWFCSFCHQRGNKLFPSKSEAQKRANNHNNKYHSALQRYGVAKVLSTKSAYLPIHVRYAHSRVTKEEFK